LEKGEEVVNCHSPYYLLTSSTSAAGKTQLALQLSLTVQLPSKLGGLSGSTCYLTTSSQLPTERLVQICENHPSLSPEICGLHEIRTLTAETIPKLVLVLSKHLPELILKLSNDSASKPVRLLVIDSLAELFHSAGRTSTNTLVERSRGIIQVSQLLHGLASKNMIAIVVLNEVTDVFSRGETNNDSLDLLYHEQARWFSRADSVPGENSKEAALGLVWANQVNARIMLSRTDRRRHFDVGGQSGKRRRLDPEAHFASSSTTSNIAMDGELLPVRRLSIIFSSVSLPASLDFIVTVAGVSIVSDVIPSHSRQSILVAQQPLEEMPMTQVPPLDEGCIRDEINTAHPDEVDVGPEWVGDEDDEQYWKDDEIFEELYSNIDLGTINEPNTKEFTV
jgi:DNA repair protein RAD57